MSAQSSMYGSTSYPKSKTTMVESRAHHFLIAYISALIYWRNEEEEDTFEFGVHYAPSATDRRRRLFLQNDPVHTTNLMTFMKDHLTLAQTTLGGAEVFREVCLRNMDDALVEQMNTMFL